MFYDRAKLEFNREKKSVNEIVFSLRDANCTDEEKGKADINHTGSDGLRFGSSFQAEE